jgi:hypothetical protein
VKKSKNAMYVVLPKSLKIGDLRELRVGRKIAFNLLK